VVHQARFALVLLVAVLSVLAAGLASARAAVPAEARPVKTPARNPLLPA
jgi:hypothetical protein